MSDRTFAPIVRRWNNRFPSRKVAHFDLSKWGAGFMRCQSAPGAIILRDGYMCDIRTGEVYRDTRFN